MTGVDPKADTTQEAGKTTSSSSTAAAAKDEDPLMLSFTIYLQILISQALEPGFLSAIQNERGNYFSIARTVLHRKQKRFILYLEKTCFSFVLSLWFLHICSVLLERTYEF